ncbi:MAG: WD40 repeat domain-containing protein [Methanoregulaceae archaeon]|nr:WD40 repeat domain-containing protein [Methanoregulaceae archaeon]
MLGSLVVLAFSGVAQTPAPVAVGFGMAASRPMLGVRAVSMAAAPTGSRVALGMEDNTIRIIDAATRQTVKVLQGHTRPVQAIAWSRDGTRIASGDERAKIYLWNTKTWARTAEISGHTRPIQNLDFNAASNQLVSTGQDDVVKIWDLKDLKRERIILPGNGANYYGAKFIGKTNDVGIATLQQGSRLYTAQKTMRGWLTAHGGQGALAVDFNPAATRALSAGRDNNASLFDMKSMQRLGNFKGHEDWVVNAIFSPNGRWVVTSSSDRTVKVWNPFNYQPVATIPEQKSVGSPLVFTADGKYLLTVDIADNVVVHVMNPVQAPVTTAPAKAKAKKSVKKRGG